jgi:transcriptional regulator with XRE-family HTH domain
MVEKNLRFIETVKKLRATFDLTQSEFANKLGISAASVAHIEGGSRGPGAAALVTLCRTAHEAGRDDLADVFAAMIHGVSEGLLVPVWRLPKEKKPDGLPLLRPTFPAHGTHARRLSLPQEAPGGGNQPTTRTDYGI